MVCFAGLIWLAEPPHIALIFTALAVYGVGYTIGCWVKYRDRL
jgi:hypothetical protein